MASRCPQGRPKRRICVVKRGHEVGVKRKGCRGWAEVKANPEGNLQEEHEELECKKCISLKKSNQQNSRNKAWHLKHEQRVMSLFLFVLICVQ